mgnify:FL=1
MLFRSTDSTLADTVADTGTPSDSGIADSALADSADTGVDTAAVPDFSLEDLNPGSVRYGEMISPRDYLEQVSGWYFIHST